MTSDARPHFVQVSEPAAYGLGCAYKWTMRNPRTAHGSRVIVLVQGTQLPFPYAQSWTAHKLSGDVFAYVQPAGG